MTYYAIQHRTRYRYSAPVSESITEARMQPRSEGVQRCLSFKLATMPQARVHRYTESNGNIVHYFDHPARHANLVITAEAVVETQPPPQLPDSLPMEAWDALDQLARTTDAFDMLLPGTLTQPTPTLLDFMHRINANTRHADPLTMVRHIKRSIYEAFEYVPESTEVDSPIDQTLTTGKGVCQDFSHIMLATCRELGIPARYVSGYLYHRRDNGGRSLPDASHAWVEVLLGELGWVGLDPTNSLLGEGRHIRVAVGREYSDVPPTRGVFKGNADSALSVEVKVELLDHAPYIDETTAVNTSWATEILLAESAQSERIRQQQEQMQQ
ncbi:MAG: transglutaminase family protein [Chloroflexota bacterium]|nr:transglutaminase family protein [Chloroflexota bacterium]